MTTTRRREQTDSESAEQDLEAQRQAVRKKREEAISFNLDLGVLAFKHLPKIKADERVLRILASVDLVRSLREIASCGARLCLPGWVTQTPQRNEKLKTTYMETYDAERRAAGFLEGAVSAGDIAGRTLTLIALASLANEQDTVAVSHQSHYELTFGGSWAVQAKRDLNAQTRDHRASRPQLGRPRTRPDPARGDPRRPTRRRPEYGRGLDAAREHRLGTLRSRTLSHLSGRRRSQDHRRCRASVVALPRVV